MSLVNTILKKSIINNNIYAQKLQNEYGKNINHLDEQQKYHVARIADLSYKAGYLEACRKFKIKNVKNKKSNYYDDDDDDDDDYY